MDAPEDLEDFAGFEVVYRSAYKTSCLINVTLENRTEEDIYQVINFVYVCIWCLILIF